MVSHIDEHGDLRIVMPPGQCSYLPGQQSALEYRVAAHMTPERFSRLLARGWRRFAGHYFRPACPTCRECRSLRVDVEAFRPSKSQRRVWRRNADVQLVIQSPTVTSTHLDLFNRYHADMQQRRGWPHRQTSAEEYISSFVGDVPFGREYLYYAGGRLIGVGLVDVLPAVSSSAYFYHDPAWRDGSPGTYSMLAELHTAKQAGRQFHYLGYWIRDCLSMAYKNRFRPHQLLREYVDDSDQPEWSAEEDTQAPPAPERD